jgi:hypothetical protein
MEKIFTLSAARRTSPKHMPPSFRAIHLVSKLMPLEFYNILKWLLKLAMPL